MGSRSTLEAGTLVCLEHRCPCPILILKPACQGSFLVLLDRLVVLSLKLHIQVHLGVFSRHVVHKLIGKVKHIELCLVGQHHGKQGNLIRIVTVTLVELSALLQVHSRVGLNHDITINHVDRGLLYAPPILAKEFGTCVPVAVPISWYVVPGPPAKGAA